MHKLSPLKRKISIIIHNSYLKMLKQFKMVNNKANNNILKVSPKIYPKLGKFKDNCSH
jgi:hypothetical protein